MIPSRIADWLTPSHCESCFSKERAVGVRRKVLEILIGQCYHNNVITSRQGCAACGTELEQTPEADRDAAEEAYALYRDDPEALANLEEEGPAVLCDDCYRRFLVWYQDWRQHD